MVGNLFGVMQGRLLPKYMGRYQAHPVGYWQQEFPIAKKLGLDCIEFILDYNDADMNPLLKDEGIDQILRISEESGVAVKTVCADYFMEAPLHASDSEVAKKSQSILSSLLATSEKLGVTDIVIPCVDTSSLSRDEDKKRFVKKLMPVVDLAENRDVNLSLETDLSPYKFSEMLDRFDSERITVNYDIGNSAALGYDSLEELKCYGDKITDIHIKDRLLGGCPVELGKGNADFNKFFSKLKELNYTGLFIMQAYRDEQGVDIFQKQFEWIKQYIEN